MAGLLDWTQGLLGPRRSPITGEAMYEPPAIKNMPAQSWPERAMRGTAENFVALAMPRSPTDLALMLTPLGAASKVAKAGKMAAQAGLLAMDPCDAKSLDQEALLDFLRKHGAGMLSSHQPAQ